MRVRADARMLDALAWRGTAVPATIARWRAAQFVEVSGRLLARPNPWARSRVRPSGRRGASPAISSRRRTASRSGSVRRPSCAAPWPRSPTERPAPSSANPTSSCPSAMRGGRCRRRCRRCCNRSIPAAAARRAPRRVCGGRLCQQRCRNEFSLAVNRILLDGTPVDVGFSVDLTIDPDAQAIAQTIAACYTGRQDALRGRRCRAQGGSGAADRPPAARARDGAWPRSRSSTSRPARIEALAGSPRLARGRSTTARAGARTVTSASRTRSATGPTRFSIPRCSTTRCPLR